MPIKQLRRDVKKRILTPVLVTNSGNKITASKNLLSELESLKPEGVIN